MSTSIFQTGEQNLSLRLTILVVYERNKSQGGELEMFDSTLFIILAVILVGGIIGIYLLNTGLKPLDPVVKDSEERRRQYDELAADIARRREIERLEREEKRRRERIAEPVRSSSSSRPSSSSRSSSGYSSRSRDDSYVPSIDTSSSWSSSDYGSSSYSDSGSCSSSDGGGGGGCD